MGFFHEVIDEIDGRRMARMLTMQDISNWQGPKAPELVAHHEILGIKATEGNNFLDPEFANNWKFADDNEKGRIAYHLLHPSQPGLQQAQFFLDYVEKAGIESGDMFAVDLEESDGKTPEEVDACAKEFLDYVAAQTKANPFVYTFIHFAEAGNCNSLGNRPLWIADPSSPPAKPRVPAPWEEWRIHQYGIFKGIDADIVNAETVDALTKYGALIGEPPPPPDIVVMTLRDPNGETRKEFHETDTLDSLRGQKFQAGDAHLEFSDRPSPL